MFIIQKKYCRLCLFGHISFITFFKTPNKDEAEYFQ